MENPGKMSYKIPLDMVMTLDPDKKNMAKNRAKVAESLMNRKFYLPSSFMMEHLGINKDRFIVPFPTVDFDPDGGKELEIHLNPAFKKVLTLLETGFTKGAIEDLREFSSRVSKVFYWIARQKQTYKQIWEVSLEDLKKEMDMSDKYDRWMNFKRRVIDVVQEEFKGTFMDFTWSPIKKGKSIIGIKFIFKHGPKEIDDKPAGMVFEWEKELLTWNVLAEKVKEIRQRVKVEQVSEEYKFVWSPEYVRYSLQGAKIEYDTKVKNSRSQKAGKGKSTISMVRNTGGWVYHGLLTGQWLGYVREMIDRDIREKQSEINFGNISNELDNTLNVNSENDLVEDIEFEELPKKIKKAVFEDSEAREIYNTSETDKPFNKFMTEMGYKKVGGRWEK